MGLKDKIIVQFILLAGFFFGLWAFITWLIPNDVKYSPSLSIETEEKIGDKLTEIMLESETEVKDREVVRQVRDIARRVKNGIKNPHYRYKIHIIQSKEANAFTLPGGNIIVYTDLIVMADNPEQLASVLAHEMGHAEKRHVISRLFRELGIAAVSGIVLNDKSGAVMKVLKHVLSMSFDRDEEREADLFAMETLVATHIHPHHFADFFEKVSERYGDHSATEFMMTHPDNNERIHSAMNYKVPDGFKELPFENIDYPALKESLDSGI